MRKNLVGSTNFCGFRDQKSHRFRDQGSNFWVKIWDHLRKNIPRYDLVLLIPPENFADIPVEISTFLIFSSCLVMLHAMST